MKKIDLVLVEDNVHDAHLFQRIVKKEELTDSMVWLKDGEVAVNELISDRKWIPKLVILDIKLPKVNGLEILKKLRAQETTKTLPVVILSSSNQQVDIQKAYHLGVNGFVTKPDNYAELKELLRHLTKFWLRFNKTTLIDE